MTKNSEIYGKKSYTSPIGLNEPITSSPSIRVFEEEYPIIAEEYKRIQSEMYATFAEKHLDYGMNNIALGGDLSNANDKQFSLTGIAIRLTDKISRLRNLVTSGVTHVKTETIEDTLLDAANYGIIGTIVRRDKWKK